MFKLCFLLCCSALATIDTCVPYNYRRATAVLSRSLRHEDSWELSSDNYLGQEVFASRSEFRQKAVLQIIPVFRINPDKLKELSFTAVYTADQETYATAFLLKEKALVSIIRTAPLSALATGKERHFRGIGREENNVPVFYKLYNSPDVCFFFDSTFNRYAYLKENKCYLYDVGKQRFIEYKTVSELRDEYRRYFSTRAAGTAG